MPKSLKEVIANADRYADAFEAFDPADSAGPDLDPIHALQMAAFQRAQAEKGVAAAVISARRNHLAWAKIGEAIGTSGQAARERYSSSV